MQVRQNLRYALLKAGEAMIAAAFNPRWAFAVERCRLPVVEGFVTGLQQQQQVFWLFNHRAAQGLQLIEVCWPWPYSYAIPFHAQL